MSLKKIVQKQLQSHVNRAAEQARSLALPKEGWIRTVRKSLGMSGAQLARRLGITRAAISNTEKAELEGRVTIRAIREAAEAMNCRLVYAIVPETDIESLIRKQARAKAIAKVKKVNQHMALEAQTLSQDRIEFEIEGVLIETPTVKSAHCKECLPGHSANDVIPEIVISNTHCYFTLQC